MTPTTDSVAALIGSKECLVTYRDGRTETVRVNALSVRDFKIYLDKLDDESGRIEMATGKPDKWADILTPSAHEDILAAVEEMNDPGFFAWLRRRVQRQERLAPGSSGELGKALLSASPRG